MLNDIYQGLDPIAFSLGPLVVRWYGLAYVLGFVCAAAIIYFVAKRWKLGMSEDNLLTLMVCAIVGVVLGARIGYVLFYGDGYYLSHPLEILAFNQGGMSFHGGLVGLLIGGAVAARITRIPFLTLADSGLHCGADWPVLRPLRQLRERRAVGRAHRRAAWRRVRRRGRHDAASSQPALRGGAGGDSSSSASCSRSRASGRRGPRAPSSAHFWCSTASSASSSSSCASPTCNWDTCGAVGSPWAKCSRRRSSWPASRCSSMRRGRGIPRSGRRRFSRRLSLAMRLRRSIGFSCNDVVSPGVAEIGVALLPVQYFKAADSASAALCNEQLQEI